MASTLLETPFYWLMRELLAFENRPIINFAPEGAKSGIGPFT
jgi:hypothetical protein